MRHRLLVVLTVMLTGCASVPPAQIGQAAGTIAGGAIVPGLGAPIGALVGMLAGLVLQGKMDQATATRERQELGSQLAHRPAPGAEAPGQSASGTPVRVWVDETFHDGRLLAGHFDTRAIP